jgi:hypothetical protein
MNVCCYNRCHGNVVKGFSASWNNICKYVCLLVSRGSSVSIVSGYGLDDRAIEVRSPAEEKGLFL